MDQYSGKGLNDYPPVFFILFFISIEIRQAYQSLVERRRGITGDWM